MCEIFALLLYPTDNTYFVYDRVKGLLLHQSQSSTLKKKKLKEPLFSFLRLNSHEIDSFGVIL